jgi:hypothetical protein
MRTYEQIEELFKQKGYIFFKGELNVNLFAMRKAVNTNIFDDEIYMVYEEGGQKIVKMWPCTTEAGKHYLNSPMNPKGTAIIVPGQYRGAYAIGRHTNYEALRQQKPLKYWRDSDRDSIHDLGGKIYEEIGYTNIHKAGADSSQVDRWSAGCIVFKRVKDFNEMMSIAKKASKKYSNSFTFTLFQMIQAGN